MHDKVNAYRLGRNFSMQKGDILKELREDRKYTQAYIAKLLQTSRQYYSDYECEKYELPLHHLEFLADLFNVSTDYLLGRTKISKPYPKFQFSHK